MVLANITQRNEDERQRYLKLYDFDLYDPNNYDIVINTDNYTAQEVAEILLFAFKHWKNKQN